MEIFRFFANESYWSNNCKLKKWVTDGYIYVYVYEESGKTHRFFSPDVELKDDRAITIGEGLKTNETITSLNLRGKQLFK